MFIAGFPAGPWGTNCYVVATGPGAECVVIDPGKDAAEGVAQVVREHRLKPVSVLVTHGHVDHMWCVAPVAGTYDATAWIHPADRHLLSDPMAGMSPETTQMLLGGDYTWAEPDDVRELSDLAELELAGLRFVVDHTPGHTEGSVTFRTPYAQQDVSEVMFSGDLLFAGSIGRTDLPGGDHATMLRSLTDKVLPLADDIVVLPGHGEQTSIGRERATNPYLQDLATGRDGPMSKIAPLSGFPELLPAQRAVEREVIASLSRTFELHGFANIETRVVEPIDRLAKGGEVDKEIYVLQRLAAEPDAKAELGMHFDLTVPFARYVLEHAGHLEFPFRRFQVQPAWRGERPQEGRFRQFTQADVDIVGRDELPFHHDVEVMSVMVDALSRLPIPRLSFQFNNRKLIQGFYRGLGIDDVTDAIRVIDKLDKLPADEVARMLVERVGTTPEQAQRCLELATIRVSDTSFVEQVRALGVTDELLDQGLDELAAVVEGCRAVAGDRVDVEANLRIARGLDYYTGTVVEVFMAGYERLKSVGGGGRYDALASDGRTTYPGVGVSFGVSRTLVPLIADGVLSGSRPVPSAVLVALNTEDDRAASTQVAAALRQRDIACEVAPSPAKFGKQIRFAERRGIPYVWFVQADGTHQVKDIRSGEQVDADPATWTPPEQDLRPTIISTASTSPISKRRTSDPHP